MEPEVIQAPVEFEVETPVVVPEPVVETPPIVEKQEEPIVETPSTGIKLLGKIDLNAKSKKKSKEVEEIKVEKVALSKTRCASAKFSVYSNAIINVR